MSGRTRDRFDAIHDRAERLVATWPGAHRYMLTSPQRIAAVKEVESFLRGETDAFGDAAHLLLDLSSPVHLHQHGVVPSDWYGAAAA